MRFAVLPLCAALVSCVALAGCVTKAHADARVREAYLAGQRDALARLQQAQVQGPSVTINGPVRNPVLLWTPRLTLSQAILVADYQGPGDPIEIIVVRNGRGSRFTVQDLLRGQDVPLAPGDVVQLVTASPQMPASPGVAPPIPGPSPAMSGR